MDHGRRRLRAAELSPVALLSLTDHGRWVGGEDSREETGDGGETGDDSGAGRGPGPRDGRMTGLAKRGLSLRVARTGIELTVLAAGFLLGGSVGIGTVLYALGIGPLAHIFIPLLAVDEAVTGRQ